MCSLERKSHGGATRETTEQAIGRDMGCEAGGLQYRATVGRYPDGRIGEIFLTNHKAGSQAGIMASDAAVVASIAIQYGAPLDVIRKSLDAGSTGSPLVAARCGARSTGR
jgi:hypothetical protein